MSARTAGTYNSNLFGRHVLAYPTVRHQAVTCSEKSARARMS